MKLNKFFINGVVITHFRYSPELSGYEFFTQDKDYKTSLVKVIKTKQHDTGWYYAKNALIKHYNYLGQLYGDKVITCDCPYCGEKSDSIDSNVLCKDCRETFGHTFIGEL
jgi:hypothetical protein